MSLERILEKLRSEYPFEEQWNLPYCVGALDGKHFVIQAPSGSESYYYSYKGKHNVVSHDTCQRNYNIIYMPMLTLTEVYVME